MDLSLGEPGAESYSLSYMFPKAGVLEPWFPGRWWDSEEAGLQTTGARSWRDLYGPSSLVTSREEVWSPVTCCLTTGPQPNRLIVAWNPKTIVQSKPFLLMGGIRMSRKFGRDKGNPEPTHHLFPETQMEQQMLSQPNSNRACRLHINARFRQGRGKWRKDCKLFWTAEQQRGGVTQRSR